MNKVHRTGVVGFCQRCGQAAEVTVGIEDQQQRRVMRARERRGDYRNWSARQLALRQTAELARDLSELARPAGEWLPTSVWTLLEGVAHTAGWQLQHGYWLDGRLSDADLRTMLDRLAMVQAGVYCLAETLAVCLGEDVDIGRMATEMTEQRGGQDDGR